MILAFDSVQMALSKLAFETGERAYEFNDKGPQDYDSFIQRFCEQYSALFADMITGRIERDAQVSELQGFALAEVLNDYRENGDVFAALWLSMCGLTNSAEQSQKLRLEWMKKVSRKDPFYSEYLKLWKSEFVPLTKAEKEANWADSQRALAK